VVMKQAAVIVAVKKMMKKQKLHQALHPHRKVKINLRDILFLFRPHIIICGLTFIFLGLIQSDLFLLSKKTYFLIFLYMIILGLLNIINEIFDIKTDRINSKPFLISQGYVTIKQAWLILFVVGIPTLIFIFLFSVKLLFISLISLFLAFLYTNPYYSFKSIPFMDLIINSLGYGFICLNVGLIIINQPIMLFDSLPFIFLMASIYILTEIPDIIPDKKANIITTAVFLGKRKSQYFALSLMFISVIYFYIYYSIIFLIFGLFFILIIIFSIFYPSKKIIRYSFLVPVILYTVYVSLNYFPLLINNVILITFVFVYHKNKFDKLYH